MFTAHFVVVKCFLLLNKKFYIRENFSFLDFYRRNLRKFLIGFFFLFMPKAYILKNTFLSLSLLPLSPHSFPIGCSAILDCSAMLLRLFCSLSSIITHIYWSGSIQPTFIEPQLHTLFEKSLNSFSSFSCFICYTYCIFSLSLFVLNNLK